MSKSPITTHILDTATGLPAANVPVTLSKLVGESWLVITQGMTNEDGRISDWIAEDYIIDCATYKLTFALDYYFSSQETPAFYPFAEVCFRLQDNKHHHIPLLLSPFGYSTYRGS